MYVSTWGLRSDQQTCECAAKLDVKAAFLRWYLFQVCRLSRFQNANMRRDPCYDQLGLRWYLFKKVVKAFHIFSFKSLVRCEGGCEFQKVVD